MAERPTPEVKPRSYDGLPCEDCHKGCLNWYEFHCILSKEERAQVEITANNHCNKYKKPQVSERDEWKQELL